MSSALGIAMQKRAEEGCGKRESGWFPREPLRGVTKHLDSLQKSTRFPIVGRGSLSRGSRTGDLQHYGPGLGAVGLNDLGSGVVGISRDDLQKETYWVGFGTRSAVRCAAVGPGVIRHVGCPDLV
jgi:hypothetical protein